MSDASVAGVGWATFNPDYPRQGSARLNAHNTSVPLVYTDEWAKWAANHVMTVIGCNFVGAPPGCFPTGKRDDLVIHQFLIKLAMGSGHQTEPGRA